MSSFYQIRHVTRFCYDEEITESLMEVRKCPVEREGQRLLSFHLALNPVAKVFDLKDNLGNTIHHFDIPQRHQELTITATSLVELKSNQKLPERVDMEAWGVLHSMESEGENLDFLLHSPRIKPTEALKACFEELKPRDNECPLSFLTRVSGDIFDRFDYASPSKKSEASEEGPLLRKQGACSDFAHLMIGLARLAKIPARYVSGYLFHREEQKNRTAEEVAHSWVEAFVPELGWVAFDPSNNIAVEDRHIATCIGRDSKDVAATRGVFKGFAKSEASVAIQVHSAEDPALDDDFRTVAEVDTRLDDFLEASQEHQAVQQQQ